MPRAEQSSAHLEVPVASAPSATETQERRKARAPLVQRPQVPARRLALAREARDELCEHHLPTHQLRAAGGGKHAHARGDAVLVPQRAEHEPDRLFVAIPCRQ